MILTQELKTQKTLHPMVQCQLLMAMNMAEAGAEVTVCLTAPKMTDAEPRQSPQDYLTLPGIAPDAQIGPVSVHRYVDNRENQRLDRVGAIYLKVRSITRANGLNPYGWTNVRLEQITGFMVLGVVTPTEEQMAMRALAQAAAQTPQGV